MIKQRIRKIQAALQPHQAALITDAAARRYVTGFPASAGLVLITSTQARFFIDSRYIEAATAAVRDCTVILLTKPSAQLCAAFAAEHITELFVETTRLNHAAVLRYRSELAPVTVNDTPFLDYLLTDLRAVKSDAEIDCIKKAQEYTDRTFDYICGFIRPGLTDAAVALEMEFYMRRLGSEGVSFDFIVVSGKNSSMPHGVPTDKVIEKGDFVTMDFGGVAGGYHADMTRTVAVGAPDDEQRRVYEIVARAQQAALATLRAGVRGKDVDAAARTVITAAGFGEYFGHGLGHSVGLEIHENPNCNTRDETPLAAGTVMTVEPGIYLPGRFGVRIEDMVAVTKDGYENLTHSPKNLIVL